MPCGSTGEVYLYDGTCMGQPGLFASDRYTYGTPVSSIDDLPVDGSMHAIIKTGVSYYFPNPDTTVKKYIPASTDENKAKYGIHELEPHWEQLT